jgi:hypothetical protein
MTLPPMASHAGGVGAKVHRRKAPRSDACCRRHLAMGRRVIHAPLSVFCMENHYRNILSGV